MQPTLPADIIPLLTPFAPLFSRPVFQHVQVLMMGAILTPGKRTVTSALRAVGCEKDKQFQKYHRVLNRDKWSPLKAARVLLQMLVAVFAQFGVIVIGIDETIERRWGRKIAARGIYRDAARSSHEYVVKTSGLRWMSAMLLSKVPWAHRVWALPFLTVLAPSERYHEQRKIPHKKSTDWARQMIKQIRRWLPTRKLVFVMDGGYSALELIHAGSTLRNPVSGVANPVTIVTTLRLDARLFMPAAPEEERKKGRQGKHRSGRKPIIGKRLPTLEQILDNPEWLSNPELNSELLNDPSIEWPTAWKPVTVESWYEQGERTVEILSGTALWYQGGKAPVPIRYVIVRPVEDCPKEEKFRVAALLSTDLEAAPEQILSWYLMRWEVEVTFQEVRTSLGVETQRQWNDKAIARTTPALLGLYSFVALAARRLLEQSQTLKNSTPGSLPGSLSGFIPFWQSAWYQKEHATFSDILALVRRHLWKHLCSDQFYSFTSCPQSSCENIFQHFTTTLDHLTTILCYAA